MNNLKELSARHVAQLDLTKHDIQQLPVDVHDCVRRYLSIKKQIDLWDGKVKIWAEDGHYGIFHYVKVVTVNKRTMAFWHGNNLNISGYMLHGPYRTYYPTGQIREQSCFKEGLQNGPAISYSRYSQIPRSYCYKDGKLVYPFEEKKK